MTGYHNMTEYTLRELDIKEMGRRVRLRREFLGWSRDQLAEKIDVSGQFIADIEYGHKGMSVQTLYKLSQALNVSADYLLGRDEFSKKEEL